jgi:hypothetical protein
LATFTRIFIELNKTQDQQTIPNFFTNKNESKNQIFTKTMGLKGKILKKTFTNNGVEGLKVRGKNKITDFSFIKITKMYNDYFFKKKCLGL